MHPGATIYVGWGGFDSDVDLPEEFENTFEDGNKVMTPSGAIVDSEEDSADVTYLRQIRSEWSCYGFVIGDFDTAGSFDISAMHEQVDQLISHVKAIAEKYGISMVPQVHILSYLV